MAANRLVILVEEKSESRNNSELPNSNLPNSHVLKTGAEAKWQEATAGDRRRRRRRRRRSQAYRTLAIAGVAGDRPPWLLTLFCCDRPLGATAAAVRFVWDACDACCNAAARARAAGRA